MTKRNSTAVSALNQGAKRKLLTTDEFIRRAKIVHGERFDYSLTEYVKTSIKLKIICKAHGVFEQQPHNHLKGVNCPKCGAENRKAYARGLSEKAGKEFKQKSNEQHNNFYNYSLVEYKSSRVKVKIICPNHGEFKQAPHEHMIGAGCPKCARERINHAVNKRRLKAAREFEEKSRKIHGDKYSYENSVYIKNSVKLDIICPHHGVFSQTPRCHLKGNGCSDCGREIASGWSRSQFIEYANKVSNGVATVYIVKCWNKAEMFYKIGVTTQTIDKRFHSNKSMPYNYTVVKTKKSDARTIYDTEIQLHRLNNKSHYTPNLPFGGSVLECFTEISQETLYLLDAI